MTRDREPAPAVTTTAPPTPVTTTAVVTATEAPVMRDQGVLLLSATPWGDIERIIDAANNQPVPVSDDRRSTPVRLDLDPGTYEITLKGPNRSQTINVEIQAGKVERKSVSMGTVNFEELAREVSQP